MAVALCPGSFDPPTNGHIDVIERAAKHFDQVVVAVIANPSKEPLFSLEQRKDLLVDVLSHLDNIEISSFDGLLVDLARDRGISVIVKGLRAVSDFEYELQMAQMNSALASRPRHDVRHRQAQLGVPFIESRQTGGTLRRGGRRAGSPLGGHSDGRGL